MDTSRANTSAVVIALLLAALLAGSLVTFSILAGGADDPDTGAVSVARLDPETEPVVLDSPEVLGARFEPAEQAPDQTPPPAAITAADRIEAIVLGTRFRNQDGKRKPGSKGAPTKTTNPGKDGGSKKDDGPKGGSKDTSKCPCGKSKEKDNTPNGHAYGYHKDPGTTGLKRGHDKDRGNSGSNGHGSGGGNSNGPSKSSGNGKGKGKGPK